jgi:hypothetical protein
MQPGESLLPITAMPPGHACIAIIDTAFRDKATFLAG